MACRWRITGRGGSAASVDNIATALSSAKNTKAVLLENHGVLAFGADPAAAARANLIVEEAAQMAIFAEVLGGAKLISPEMLRATVGRKDEFASEGYTAGLGKFAECTQSTSQTSVQSDLGLFSGVFGPY